MPSNLNWGQVVWLFLQVHYKQGPKVLHRYKSQVTQLCQTVASNDSGGPVSLSKGHTPVSNKSKSPPQGLGICLQEIPHPDLSVRGRRLVQMFALRNRLFFLPCPAYRHTGYPCESSFWSPTSGQASLWGLTLSTLVFYSNRCTHTVAFHFSPLLSIHFPSRHLCLFRGPVAPSQGPHNIYRHSSEF